jgi:hypothetical protein
MKTGMLALVYAFMLPKVPTMNAGKVWLQCFAVVFANGRVVLPMKTNTRIDSLGVDHGHERRDRLDRATEYTSGKEVHGGHDGAPTVRAWYRGTSWKKTETAGMD